MQSKLVYGIIIFIFCTVVYDSVSCLPIINTQFRTTNEVSEVAVLPNSDTDPVEYYTYYPTIRFRVVQYTKQESDVLFSGSYSCWFGLIFARSSTGQRAFAYYDLLTGDLRWGREVDLYQNQNLARSQGLAILLLLIFGLCIREVFRRGWL
jgi:hypothetical protein